MACVLDAFVGPAPRSAVVVGVVFDGNRAELVRRVELRVRQDLVLGAFHV